MNAGLNLYSVCNFLKTEEDFLDAANKLREMGYSYMQYSGGEYIPERLRRVSEASGMPIVLTHMSSEQILNNADKLMEEHAGFGCKNIGLGSIPIIEMMDGTTVDEKKCKTIVQQLNDAGEYLQKNGYKFFLHNHHYEFMRMSSGEQIFDYIVENAPYINFTLDTYWLQFAGADVLSVIDRLKGRIECVHLKDYKIVVDTKLDYFDCCPAYECVGYGNMDFKTIVPKMKEAGTKYFLVEHDSASTMPDPLAVMEKSIRYIKAEL